MESFRDYIINELGLRQNSIVSFEDAVLITEGSAVIAERGDIADFVSKTIKPLLENLEGIIFVEKFIIRDGIDDLENPEQRLYDLGERYYQEQGFSTSFEEDEFYKCLVARNGDVTRNMMIFLARGNKCWATVTIDDGTMEVNE